MSANWSDLGPRVGSAIVMVAVGGVALWLGGLWFAALVGVCAGLMVWELARMSGAGQGVAILLGIMGAVAVQAPTLVGGIAVQGWLMQSLPFVMVAPALAGAVLLSDHRRRFALYAMAVIGACAALLMLRFVLGLGPVLLLIGVVVATDIAGYFAGRLIGGPKFWPSISPNKTWSGTAAGWLAAAAVVLIAGGGPLAVAAAVLLSFASQMGDIAESAFKRHVGVKDSSNLIPGHGGLLDRFDGLAGASLAALVLLLLFGSQAGAG